MSKQAKTWLFFLLCSILVYELPYFLTLAKTGWTALPAVVDYPADQMLYLNLSVIRYGSPTEVINPWYGTRVPALDVPHLRFPITFRLFNLTHAIFRSWTLAMLVWAAVWAGLSFAAAVFCLRSMFPQSDNGLINLWAFGLLVLQSPLVYLVDLRRLPSIAGFHELSLPFLRFAFPQVIVPALFAYLALQVRVLKDASKWALAGMALLQLATLSAFPYAVLVMAVGTAITILIAKFGKKDLALSWRAVLLFGAICAVLDAAYVGLAGLGQSHGNVRFALQFRPEIFLPSLRPYVLLLVIGAAFALASRICWAAKTTAAGLALSSSLLAFSDVFFPATSIMLNHVNYVITITTWLPLIAGLWPWIEKLNRRSLRIALTSVFLLISVWEGYASYRRSLPINLFHAVAGREIERLALTSRDLLIAPSQFSDDVSCWAPLIAPARILFTRDAENILSADSIKGEQALRQALYLELSGVSYSSFMSFTEPGSPDSRINPIALFGELGYASSPFESDHLHVRNLIRERLGPMFVRLESDPASARSLLQGYDRIIVLDNSREPRFSSSTLSRWLEIRDVQQHDGIQVWICYPRTGG